VLTDRSGMINVLSLKAHHPEEKKKCLVILELMSLLDLDSIFAGKGHELF
jgi:hypothetical protein